ncbi:hypothetical protein DSUL_50084 [Desulfovibrionales bacterium]
MGVLQICFENFSIEIIIQPRHDLVVENSVAKFHSAIFDTVSTPSKKYRIRSCLKIILDAHIPTNYHTALP